MAITRRLLLGASLAAPAAIVAMPAAADVVITDTPLLPMQHGPAGHLLTAKWRKPTQFPLNPYHMDRIYSSNESHGRMLAITAHRMVPETKDLVRSAIEAEERIFAAAYQRYDERSSMKPISGHDALNFMAISNSNLLAVRNRRGAGNMIFMHPALAERMTLLVRDEERIVGRWRRIGTHQHSISVFVSDHLHRDEFFCAYKADSAPDGAGVMLKQNGRMFLLTPPDVENEEYYYSLHRPENYVTHVRI